MVDIVFAVKVEFLSVLIGLKFSKLIYSASSMGLKLHVAYSATVLNYLLVIANQKYEVQSKPLGLLPGFIRCKLVPLEEEVQEMSDQL